MWSLPQKEATVWFLVSLLFAASSCHGNENNAVVVVGSAECADCEKSNVKSSQAFSGLQVSIDCKSENEELKTRGVGELDEEGKFKVSLPQDIVNNGKLKEECYAQLHNASSSSGPPCPEANNGLESSKLVLKSIKNGVHHFCPTGILNFSLGICTSAFFSHLPPPIPIYKKPFPPLHPYFKKSLLPPVPVYKKPLLPPVPVYKKPCPPLHPYFKKPFPPLHPYFKKPLPPPIPVYKKPLLPPVPIYKKPFPPLHPYFKKPLPPPVPIYKKPLLPPIPVYKKPFPPLHPYFNKPFPPHHHKIGKLPPISPPFTYP